MASVLLVIVERGFLALVAGAHQGQREARLLAGLVAIALVILGERTGGFAGRLGLPAELAMRVLGRALDPLLLRLVGHRLGPRCEVGEIEAAHPRLALS